jgi:hypothetical protein
VRIFSQILVHGKLLISTSKEWKWVCTLLVLPTGYDRSKIMLCDFSAGVEMVSFSVLPQGKVPAYAKTVGFRSIEAGSWQLAQLFFRRNSYQPQLCWCGILLIRHTGGTVPKLIPLRYYNKEQCDHRLEGISSEDVDTLLKTLENILDGAWDRPVLFV